MADFGGDKDDMTEADTTMNLDSEKDSPRLDMHFDPVTFNR